jgi:hypothetical protein
MFFFKHSTFMGSVQVSNLFFQNLKHKKVSIETFLWNWIMVMEKITKSTNLNLLANLPAFPIHE